MDNLTYNICKKIIGFLLIALLFIACKSNPKRYSAKEKKEFEKNLVIANKGLVKKDQNEISGYIAKRKWNMKKTKTGLWYEIIKHGNGKKAEAGMVAQLRYEIVLLNGTLCYSSDSLGIKKFKIGQGGVESGLEEAVLLLKSGDYARFIMPPHLAHGLIGDDNKIPPRSTIVYNVELIKLTHY